MCWWCCIPVRWRAELDQQISHRRSTRSVAGLAATLAHEVKNPLSGIRGAAQLLEPAVGEDDQPLIQLICDETDRICALVDRMEEFGDTAPIERRPVNIHQVLEHVRRDRRRPASPGSYASSSSTIRRCPRWRGIATGWSRCS